MINQRSKDVRRGRSSSGSWQENDNTDQYCIFELKFFRFFFFRNVAVAEKTCQ